MYIYSFIINFCKQLLKYDNFATKVQRLSIKSKSKYNN